MAVPFCVSTARTLHPFAVGGLQPLRLRRGGRRLEHGPLEPGGVDAVEVGGLEHGLLVLVDGAVVDRRGAAVALGLADLLGGAAQIGLVVTAHQTIEVLISTGS